MRQETAVVLSKIQGSKGLPGAGEGVQPVRGLGWGRQRIGGPAFLIIPLTDKASPEKCSRGCTGKGVKWNHCGEKRWKKRVRDRVQDKGGQGAELSSSMDKWLSLSIFQY